MQKQKHQKMLEALEKSKKKQEKLLKLRQDHQ